MARWRHEKHLTCREECRQHGLQHQMFGHCNNNQMRATYANYNMSCTMRGDTKCIACDIIEIKSSPTYNDSRAGTSLQQADKKLVWVLDISGSYPIGPDGAIYLLHAANNKCQIAWVCGLVKKSDASKCIAAFVVTFESIGLKPKRQLLKRFRREWGRGCRHR